MLQTTQKFPLRYGIIKQIYVLFLEGGTFMRLLHIDLLRPGMRIGKPIYSEDGTTLLGSGVELTSPVISKLARLGIDHLYIEDKRTEDIPVIEIISPAVRAEIRSSLMHIFQLLQSTGTMWQPADRIAIGKAARHSITLLMDEVTAYQGSQAEDDAIMPLNLFRRTFQLEEHFIQNAINVCVYALRVGIIENFSKDNLSAIGLGALFHDIGNTLIPSKLLQKTSPLTPLEYSEVKKHTEYGYQLLKDVPGMPLISAHCALQHHEQVGGGGYPLGVSGKRIHPFAQWVGMLDAYDAMTNPRPYRNALSPDCALEILFAGSDSLYDRTKVEFFRNKVAIFPIGMSVRLSTGESGIVSRITAYKHRPIVRVLTDAAGIDLKEPYEVDLSRKCHIVIQPEEDAFALLNSR